MRSDRQIAVIRRLSGLGDDHLLTPREAAEVFGVRTATVALWAREGRLDFTSTPGAHRRYRLGDIRALLGHINSPEGDSEAQMAEDAVRLYGQGWSIAKVADKFDVTYNTMRRLLARNGVQFR